MEVVAIVTVVTVVLVIVACALENSGFETNRVYVIYVLKTTVGLARINAPNVPTTMKIGD